MSKSNILENQQDIGSHAQIFIYGEAKISEGFGERVYSFDFIPINDKVTECNMKSVPLENESLDVVIFSLSLMGRNWTEYLSEAKRCLATIGYLIIAETTKSLSSRLSNLREVILENGFDIYSNQERGDFTFIESRKL